MKNGIVLNNQSINNFYKMIKNEFYIFELPDEEINTERIITVKDTTSGAQDLVAAKIK